MGFCRNKGVPGKVLGTSAWITLCTAGLVRRLLDLVLQGGVGRVEVEGFELLVFLSLFREDRGLLGFLIREIV